MAECAPRIERILRRLNIPHQARGDARQEAAIAVLEAIESFDAERGASFWTWAFYQVFTSLRRWLGHGLYWCPPSHGGSKAKGKDELESASRRGTHLSATSILDAANLNLNNVHLPSCLVDAMTPERQVSDMQQLEQVRVFLGKLSPADRALLLSSSSAKSERRAELLDAAREFFGEGCDHGAH